MSARFIEQLIAPNSPQPKENSLETIIRLRQGLGNYLGLFYDRLALSPEKLPPVLFRTAEIIERNNHIADIIDSPRFAALLTQEREMIGDCRLTASKCIDGRLAIIHVLGRAISTWTSKAGEINTIPSPFDHRDDIKSGILEASISATAARGRNYLNVSLAHTSLKNPDHGCGAMREKRNRGTVPATGDLVLENLKIHEQNNAAITHTYNRFAQQYNGHRLQTASISAVSDTDTLGLVLGYNTPDELDTSRLTSDLTPQIADLMSTLHPIYAQPGIAADFFTKSDHFIDFYEMLVHTTKTLLTSDATKPVRDYVENNYGTLNVSQKHALIFLLARTISMQYLTGLHKAPHHAFSDHGEGYQAISQDGPFVGNFDPELQVFGANVGNIPDAVDHILTQSAIMDQAKKTEHPHILFTSFSVSPNQPEASIRRALGRNREFFMNLVANPQIKDKIIAGELVIIPTMIDGHTRKILYIPNYAL